MAEGKLNPGIRIFLTFGSLMMLYYISLKNYLLFHSIIEFFSIVVVGSLFVLSLNARVYMTNHYLLFLGMAYLFVGILDLLHTLSYKGMGVFSGITANEPTQLWIGARLLESFSLVVAPFFIKRSLSVLKICVVYVFLTAGVIFSVFFLKIFPDCFIEGKGLTLFKKVSEYIVCVVLIVAGAFFYKNFRKNFTTRVVRLILGAIITTVVSELFFTFYVSVYGFSNMFGHLLKFLSFYFLYAALVETGIREPMNLIFKELKDSNEKLIEEKEKLEEAIGRIKTLEGLLPICSHCKNIRDDKGYWQSVEKYISTHTGASFSHGICPDCLEKYYGIQRTR